MSAPQWSVTSCRQKGVFSVLSECLPGWHKKSDACSIGNGKYFIVHIIRSVSMLKDGAHNCNRNGLHLFRWSISLGVPSKSSAKSEVNFSVTVHSGVRDPICLYALPTSCKVSETEPDCMGLRLVERRPSQILLPKTYGHGAKSVEMSWRSMECVAQNSSQHPQCLLEAVDCLATMLDQALFCASKRSVQNACWVAGGTAARALAVDNEH